MKRYSCKTYDTRELIITDSNFDDKPLFASEEFHPVLKKM
jgi:hypothetical protein